MRFDIVGEPSAALLCRLLGLVAQQDLTAPEMDVRVRADDMIVRLEIADIAGQAGVIVAEKMARCIGVAAVAVDGTPL